MKPLLLACTCFAPFEVLLTRPETPPDYPTLPRPVSTSRTVSTPEAPGARDSVAWLLGIHTLISLSGRSNFQIWILLTALLGVQFLHSFEHRVCELGCGTSDM